jgi:23S rRNA pseudouridine2605 synthase
MMKGEKESMRLRLQKLMAQAGVASRRASEALIRQGRVQVNGQVITEMGVQVDPSRDRISVDGRAVHIQTEKRYIKLYKPVGYLSVMVDDRGRPALGNLVPATGGLHPVGRLDLDSEGLILLTNDGDVTLRLTHPRYGHDKEYMVKVDGTPGERALRALRQGVELEDGPTAEARVDRVYETPWGPAEAGRSWIRVVIHEGRKRQIRRMCNAVGHPARRLVRVRFGPILLGDLKPGQWRPLTSEETAGLLESARRQRARK